LAPRGKVVGFYFGYFRSDICQITDRPEGFEAFPILARRKATQQYLKQATWPYCSSSPDSHFSISFDILPYNILYQEQRVYIRTNVNV